MKRKHKRFTEKGLLKALEEIKARHKRGYMEVISEIVSQIKEAYHKMPRKPKLIIGLSGGLDSAVVSCLAVRAAGAGNVIPITMPLSNGDECVYFSNIARKWLGISPGFNYVMPIGAAATEIESMLGFKKLDRITKGNIASRIRINVLYAIARELNGLVLGTSNRTEFVQGYATKYGTPMSCDFGVLDDLYKTDIKEIAKILKVPDEILNRAPSTGFFPGQSHEEELGAALEEQDAAAYLLFEKGLSVNEAAGRYGASKGYLNLMMRRYNDSRHKRMLQVEHVRLGYIKNGR